MKKHLLRPVKTFYIAVLNDPRSPFVRILCLFYRGNVWKLTIYNHFNTTKKNYRGNGIGEIKIFTIPKNVTFFVAILF